MVRFADDASGEFDEEAEIARLVRQKLYRLSKQEYGGGLLIPDTSGHKIMYRSIATYLQKNPTPAVPLDKAFDEVTRWLSHIRHAKLDMETAEELMRHHGEYDNANALSDVTHQLDSLTHDFKTVHDHLEKLRVYKQKAPGIVTAKDALKNTRQKLTDDLDLPHQLKDLITSLDKAHRDLFDSITQQSWTIRNDQIEKHGFTLAAFNADPNRDDFRALGLTDLHNACMRLDAQVMDSLHKHIGGLYMLSLEEQARISVEQRRNKQ